MTLTERESIVLKTPSFIRSIGFHVFGCHACGDQSSGMEEDVAIYRREHGCGPIYSNPPEGWQADASKEMNLEAEKSLKPLILRMKVKPAKEYREPKSIAFSKAVDALLKEGGDENGILAERKMKFVVGTMTLPGMARSKAESKPLERYWPVYETPAKYASMGLRIDRVWYDKMVEGYIQSAFGLESMSLMKQGNLSSWF